VRPRQGPCPARGRCPSINHIRPRWQHLGHDQYERYRAHSAQARAQRRALPPGSGDTFGETEGLSSNTTGGIVEDTEGDIWISTSSGLDRFRAANVVVETSIPPSAADHYFAIRDADGTIVIGDGHKFYQILPNADPVVASEVISGLVTHICANADGKHWFQTADNNISEVEQGHLIKIPNAIIPSSSNLLGCAIDKYGAFWISVSQKGLYRFDGSNWAEFNTLKDAPHDWPRTMTVDNQGRLLLYFGRRSLVRIDGDRVETLLAANDNKIGLIPVIAPGARYMLLGGEKGLAQLDGDRLRTLTSSQYPWLGHISGIAQTGRGETWLIGIDRIIRLSTAELEAAFEKPDGPLSHEVFDVNDGLPNFAGIIGLDLSRSNDLEGGDGRIWFTITDRVVWIDPAHLTRNRLPPPVSIQRLIANERPYALPLSGSLPKGVSKLEIDYTALSLTFPQRKPFPLPARWRRRRLGRPWQTAGRPSTRILPPANIVSR
jgi:hypothetical protein